jgi:DNA-binding LytR/AlgR family response regulator
MSIINVLVLEDDAFEATILKDYLEQSNFNIVKVAKNIEDAINAYHSNTVDFIIIDIFLNGKPEGITFAKTLLKDNPKLTTPFLFLTGHTDRAIFEEARLINPHGYVLKPFNELELAYTIELILEKHNNSIANNIVQDSTIALPYFFKKNAIFHKVLPNAISYVEVEGRYCKINTSENSFISQYTLADFNKQLPESFVRVHRNYVVNTTKIIEVHPDDNLIVLENNETITLSRKYKSEFFEYYNTIKKS